MSLQHGKWLVRIALALVRRILSSCVVRRALSRTAAAIIEMTRQDAPSCVTDACRRHGSRDCYRHAIVCANLYPQLRFYDDVSPVIGVKYHIPKMSSSTSEKLSSKERQDIWVELQSLRRDTQSFRTEAYRLRTTGGLDTATNERLRVRQLELECRGEALIKRCVNFRISFWPKLNRHRLSRQLEWKTGQTSGT
jgi:hypothetical protein